MGGSLVVGIVSLGMLGGSPDAPGREPTDTDVAPLAASAAPGFRSRLGIEPDQALVVTSPAGRGQEISTRRLVVSGYVVGEPVAIRISLQGRGERDVDTVTVAPVRSPNLTRPQRAGQFEVTFDLPDPRPSGVMTVEVALLTAEGQVIDLARRRIRVGTISETVSPRRVVGEDGLMGGIPFR